MEPLSRESTFTYHGLQITHDSTERAKKRSWISALYAYFMNMTKANNGPYPETTDIHATMHTSPELVQVDQIKQQIRTFLQDIKFDRSSPFLKDRELEVAVWNYFQNLELGETEKSVQRTLKISVTFTKQAYTALPFKVKVVCAIQSLYMFLIDDIADNFMEDLQSFGQNFSLNKPHRQHLLNGFDRHLRELSLYYGPYCHSAIVKSSFDYVNGRIIENRIDQSEIKFCADSRLMPMFLRAKVGGAEILLHLLWPNTNFPESEYVVQYFPALQDLIIFTDFTNDILSYYKEFVLRDEKGNFVANFAQTHDMQHLDVLRHLTSYTPKVLQAAHRMVQDSPDLVRSIDTFARGWVMLFTAHRRYHLVDLFEDEHYLPPYDEDA